MNARMKIFAVGLLIAACQSTNPVSEPVSCSVAPTADGGQTITCGDSSVTVSAPANGASCTATTQPNGAVLVKCGDQTVELPPGAAGEPGASGQAGQPGTPGATGLRGGGTGVQFDVNASPVSALVGEITSVSIAGQPTVEFTVTDAAGRGAVGLGAVSNGQLAYLRFALAKLNPAATGETPKWESYVNVAATAATGVTGVTGYSSFAGLAPVVGAVAQGSFDRKGLLIDHGDGSYTYRFFTDVTQVTSPRAVTYDASLTHRLVIQISGSNATTHVTLPALNLSHDFRPDAQPIVTTRKIAIVSSCNECHGKLVAHGGRYELSLCETCHTRDLVDPDTGNSLDLPYMVHAIHGSAKRQEVVGPTGLPSYAIFAGGKLHDFTQTKLPQQVNNCRKCHNVADAETPLGDAWSKLPQREVCTGCHLLPTSTPDHSGFDNSMCGLCHKVGGTAGSIEDAHLTDNATLNNPYIAPGPSGALPRGFVYDIASVTLDAERYPVITFRILHDPNIGDNNPANPADPTLLPNPTPYTPLDLYALPADLTSQPAFLLSYSVPTSTRAWRPNQLYSVGDRVLANGNLYTAVQGGVGGTGAPTGTVPGIADAAVIWDYVSAAPPAPAGTEDFNNYNPAQLSAAAQPLSVNVNAATLPSGPSGATNTTSVVDVGGQTYYRVTLKRVSTSPTAASTVIPVGATLATVALQSYYSQANYFGAGKSLARHTQSTTKVVSDPSLGARRQVVDSAKCANCHEWFEGHGGGRVITQFDGVQVCVSCHTPSLTSSGRSNTSGPAGGAAGAQTFIDAGYPVLPTGIHGAALQWPEASNNFKDMIHGLHAGDTRAHPLEFVRDRSGGYYYNFGEVKFPAPLSMCEKCHKPGTYATEMAEGRAPSTQRIGGVGDFGAGVTETTVTVAQRRLFVPNDTDLVTTPIAAACASCHDGDLALAHMRQNGAAIAATRSSVVAPLTGESLTLETCSLCHGVGRSFDVSVVHAE